MHHSPIALGPPDEVEEGIGIVLAALAAGLDTRFVQAGMTLATAIETIDRVVAALDAITGALDGDSAGTAIRDLKAIADRLTELPTEQAARTAELARINMESAALRAGLLDMHKCLYVLHIYGTNIKIAAAAEPAIVVFVESMSTKLDFGRRLLDGLVARLKDLGYGVTCVAQTGRLLAKECALVVPDVPRKLGNDAAALDIYLRSLADVAHRVAEIARAVQGQVGIALGTLQVGDSTRQRLEHVVAALQILETMAAGAGDDDTPAPAVGGIVRRMLAAQLEATADTFDEGATRLVASLRDLAPETSRLLALIEQEGNGEGRAFLAQLEQGIGEVARLTDQLSAAEERALAMFNVVSKTVDDLTGHLKQIRSVQIDVQDIATNTRLLCRRQGAIGKAVSVIAAEIDVQANSLGAAMNAVGRPIDALVAINESMQRAEAAQVIDTDKMLHRALEVVRNGCLRTERAIGTGGDDARQLINLLDLTADELSAQLALGDRIRATAAELRAAAADGAPDEKGAFLLHELLPRIAALYTMASERNVHTQALPAAFAPPPAAYIADDDEEDDDGLF